MGEVRWHGRGGQGSFTVARLLGAAAVLKEGRHALAFPSFGPERRGAPVTGFTRIADQKITDRSEVTACDFVVVLDETLIDGQTSQGLRPGGKIIVNTLNPDAYENILGQKPLALDATSLAIKHLGKPITNTAMLGALIAASGIVSLEAALGAIEIEMKPSIASKNQALVKEAFEILKGGMQNDQA